MPEDDETTVFIGIILTPLSGAGDEPKVIDGLSAGSWNTVGGGTWTLIGGAGDWEMI